MCVRNGIFLGQRGVFCSNVCTVSGIIGYEEILWFVVSILVFWVFWLVDLCRAALVTREVAVTADVWRGALQYVRYIV